ncbi:hypothetical protein ACFWPH_32895 [Nocardia sp. NPDC058499]|uniref:hypothetical protein n=1 Tax=Nocardia sp. NPDC058499 TaxID=3346530 RepID=UPI00365BFD9E
MSKNTSQGPGFAAGPDREQQLRDLYKAAGIPYGVRLGPIEHDYGPAQARLDSIHASCLREIQNLSALRARLMKDRSYLELSELERSRMDLTFNALNGARLAAEYEGVPPADIDTAEETGKTGTPWVHGPSHQHLGRIEQLSDDLEQAHDLIDAYERSFTVGQELIAAQRQTIGAQREKIAALERANAELSQRLSPTPGKIAELEERLDHARREVTQLWDKIEDYQWERGTYRTGPTPDEMIAPADRSGEPDPGMKTETDPPSDTTTEIGEAITSAIEEALSGQADAWSSEDGPPPTDPATGSGPEPEATP